MSSAPEYTAKIVEQTLAAVAALPSGTASAGRPGTNQPGAVVLMAHNGPFGLGGQAHNMCGVDW